MPYHPRVRGSNDTSVQSFKGYNTRMPHKTDERKEFLPNRRDGQPNKSCKRRKVMYLYDPLYELNTLQGLLQY